MNEAKRICEEHDTLMDARGLPTYDQLKVIHLALIRALGDLLDQCDSLEHITFSRDFVPYKAEAVWNDVNNHAKSVYMKAKE